MPASSLAVAVGGFGAIGRKVAEVLDRQAVPGLTLAAVSAQDRPRAEARMAGFRRPVPVLPLAELGGVADIVVECAPGHRLREVAEPALDAGRRMVVISVAALLDAPDLQERARAGGGQIVVPTGALIGLDAVAAAAEGTIHRVRMTTRKPPRGLMGAPHVVAQGLALDGLTEPLRLFSGTAREAARGFPDNLNVAAALALAGIGPERTELEVWADPGIDRNRHRIEVEADSASFSMEIANIPSENPKTGRITALSILATLRKLGGGFWIGT